MQDIAFWSAKRLAGHLRRRKIGCLELLDHYLARVERHNPALNAIIATDIPAARKRAKAADRALAKGESWGPLHGVPMTIKESYDVAGMPTTWGIPELKSNTPKQNALAVNRLLEAGVVLFGKTNVPLMLADWQSYNAVYGTTNNPWDLARSPGGSSGGSAAALAAGLTGIEAGSDIGASIRNPAHYCGVFGHKPTYGICPPRGQALPGRVAAGDISVIGPLARSADDLAIALAAMAGPDADRRRRLSPGAAGAGQDRAQAVQGRGDARRSEFRGRPRGTESHPGACRLPCQKENQGERQRASGHRHRSCAARVHCAVAFRHVGAPIRRGVPPQSRRRAHAGAWRRDLFRPPGRAATPCTTASGSASTRSATACG